MPRGTGTVTRCPIVLQLINISDAEAFENGNWQNRHKYKQLPLFDVSGVWCEFLHDPGQQYNFDEVEEEIKKQTEILAGNKNGICYEEISLKVFSNKVVQLTLVDLPGIVKVKSIKLHAQLLCIYILGTHW